MTLCLLYWLAASALISSEMESTSDVFDVAEARMKLFATQATTWTRKRNEIDKLLTDALEDALSEADPCESTVKMRHVEDLVRRRKIANVNAYNGAMRNAARRYFATDRLYNIIYVDPPWKYETPGHHCDADYPRMSVEDLARMPVGGLAEPDCVLVMWTTFHMLEAACSLFAAWGFEQKTIFMVWVKVDRTGEPMRVKGAYTMPNAEFCIFGTRGKSLQIAQRTAIISSVVRWRPREHSQKPPVVRDSIVRIFGDLPRIELFARTASPDWDVWGNQTDKFGLDLLGYDAVNPALDAFVPRRLDYAMLTNDRVYRVDKAGAAEAWSSATLGTSFSRHDARIDAEAAEPPVVHPPNASFGERLPYSAFTGYGNITSYISGIGGLRVVRNSLYHLLSEATVRDEAERIKQRQDHNGDLLFALNNNKRQPRVRVRAAPTVSMK